MTKMFHFSHRFRELEKPWFVVDPSSRKRKEWGPIPSTHDLKCRESVHGTILHWKMPMRSSTNSTLHIARWSRNPRSSSNSRPSQTIFRYALMRCRRKDSLEKAAENRAKISDIIRFDVGGHKYAIAKKTLTESQKLSGTYFDALISSGMLPESNGEISQRCMSID